MPTGKRVFFIVVFLVPTFNLLAANKIIKFYDEGDKEDAKFVYELLAKKKEGIEEKNGPDTYFRVSTQNLLCNMFSAKGNDGKIVTAIKWEFNFDGDREISSIGGLEGGERLHTILAKLLGKPGSLTARALQCVKSSSKDKPTYACGVLP